MILGFNDFDKQKTLFQFPAKLADKVRNNLSFPFFILLSN